MKVFTVKNGKLFVGLDPFQNPGLPQLFLQVGVAEGMKSLMPDDSCIHVPEFPACVVPDQVSNGGIIERASIRNVERGGVELVVEQPGDTKNALVCMEFESGDGGFVLFQPLGANRIDCPVRGRSNYNTCLNPPRCALCGTRGNGKDIHREGGRCFEPLDEGNGALKPVAFYTSLAPDNSISRYYRLYELPPGIRVRVRAILEPSFLWSEAACDVYWDGNNLSCEVPLQL